MCSVQSVNVDNLRNLRNLRSARRPWRRITQKEGRVLPAQNRYLLRMRDRDTGRGTRGRWNRGRNNRNDNNNGVNILKNN